MGYPPGLVFEANTGAFGTIFWIILDLDFENVCSLFSGFWRRFWIDQGKRGGGLAALRRFGSGAPGLVPAHGVQSPIPSSAAALRNGVLDGAQAKLLSSTHPAIHLLT